jgi:ABC-type multidrug transport system ATPase subunit
MTGYETLWFFGKIRGIPHEILEKRVQELIVETDLLPYANIPCGKYSGGNKRKLSLAVALIGNPKVLLLDEVMRVSFL